MPSTDFIAASYELFQAGEVEILEWSFDMGFQRSLPDWCQDLLKHYSQSQALLGHGVTLSLLSAEWTERQAWWLEQLDQELQTHSYQRISEHFGFLTTAEFHEGSPMPVPQCQAALDLGRARLQQFSERCQCPVGLENLAFAFSAEEASAQGRFLGELLEPVDGYLVLDLHNLYCLVENFHLEPFSVLNNYPLERVRELHISGGSWFEGPGGQRLRRDTHDGPVPEPLFDWLPKVIERCPQVDTVILERIEGTLPDPSSQQQFRRDYRRLKDTLEAL